MSTNALFIIPVRMASTRLAQKALVDIRGKPMIQHVFERTRAANLGPVIVACDHPDVAAVIKGCGGDYVMTDPDLPSGSDRIFSALQARDPQNQFNVIVNVQGDLPTINYSTLKACLNPLARPHFDMATLACTIQSNEELIDTNVVKIALTFNENGNTGSALYFSRAPIPHGDTLHYHHIGLYAYRRATLERFVGLPPSPLELAERLEQLRALEDGMRIGVEIIHQAPWGVDTQDDLDRVRSSWNTLTESA